MHKKIAQPIKLIRLLKMIVILIMIVNLPVTAFTEALQRMSLGSKYDEINEFYTLLSDFKNHKPITAETKNSKNRILNNIKQLYDKYFDAYKKNYGSEKVKNKEKGGRDYKRFKIIYNKGQEPKSTKKEKAETKNPDEMQKPLWIKSTKNAFDSLTEDVYNNLNNNKFKTTVNKKAYDLKNAKKFLVKITTHKISEKRHLNCILIW